MPRRSERALLAGPLTGLVVGAAWGLVDGFGAWDRTTLHLGAGQGLVVVLAGVGLGAALAALGCAIGAVLPRLRRPLEAGAVALAVVTLATALARLVREPVLGRDVQLLPGGVPVALAVCALVVALPLLAVLVLSARRPAAAVALWKLWAVALVLVTWFTPRGPRPVAVEGAPRADASSLVLVTLDTFRADHTGALGADGDPTPRLDALAEQGVLFTRATSQIPITGPSHMSILSGTYPWTHETLANGVAVPDGVAVLPEIAGRAGYRTAAFVSAFVLDGVFGYGRGFQVYDDALQRPKGVFELSPMRVWEQVRVRLGDLSDVERRGAVTVDDALVWLDTVDPGEPFFLWVHLFDPHGPYEPPPPYDTRYYDGDPRDPAHDSLAQASGVAEYMLDSLAGITDIGWPLAQYRGEIAYTDAQLGRLLDGLTARGLDDETIVTVVADHGESLTEHDYYFNHGAHLYAPSMHVPLVMVAPGQLPAGAVVDQVVENVDLLPTWLTLLGLPVPGDLPGESLIPLARGEASGDGQALTICFDREANKAEGAFMRYRRLGIRTGSVSFVYREQGPAEFYDLAADPGETNNLALRADHGHVVQPLSDRAAEILATAGTGAFERASGELGAGVEERLRALGYVEDE